MRATTLKASTTNLGGLLAYYTGLATGHADRDGLSRGPIDYYLDPAGAPGPVVGRRLCRLEDDPQEPSRAAYRPLPAMLLGELERHRLERSNSRQRVWLPAAKPADWLGCASTTCATPPARSPPEPEALHVIVYHSELPGVRGIERRSAPYPPLVLGCHGLGLALSMLLRCGGCPGCSRFWRRRWPLIVVHVVLVAVGIMFVAIGLDVWNAQRPIESGVVTTGRVGGHAVKEYTDQDGYRQTAR